MDLKPTYTRPAHKGGIKSLAAAGPYIASGGADDLIHLYDVRHDKDLGFLMNPGEGAVTALAFFTPSGSFLPSHMLTGSSDGTLSIWIAGQGWQCMKTLRGHRHEVNSIAVHHTGLLALTTSRDGTLRLWDLVKGRTTFKSKLEEEAEEVAFSPSGTKYLLRCATKVVIVPVSTSASEAQRIVIDHPRKVMCSCFGSNDESLITATDDGTVWAWHIPLHFDNTQQPTIAVQLEKAHSTRIKAMAVPCLWAPEVSSGSMGDTNEENVKEHEDGTDNSTLDGFPAYLATASSDGVLSLWALKKALHHATNVHTPIVDASSFCLGSAKTGARLTVLIAVENPEVMDVRAMQLSALAKSKKNTNKKHKNKKRHKSKSDTPECTAATKMGMRTRGEKVLVAQKEQGTKLLSSPHQQTPRQQGKTTVLHGTEVVSFMDEKDAERAAKKKKKIEIQAKRTVGHTKRSKRPKTMSA